MEYAILICKDCKEEFVFTEEARLYFLKRKMTNPPKRCKSCYHEHREARRPGQEDETTG